MNSYENLYEIWPYIWVLVLTICRIHKNEKSSFKQDRERQEEARERWVEPSAVGRGTTKENKTIWERKRPLLPDIIERIRDISHLLSLTYMHHVLGSSSDLLAQIDTRLEKSSGHVGRSECDSHLNIPNSYPEIWVTFGFGLSGWVNCARSPLHSPSSTI